MRQLHRSGSEHLPTACDDDVICPACHSATREFSTRSLRFIKRHGALSRIAAHLILSSALNIFSRVHARVWHLGGKRLLCVDIPRCLAVLRVLIAAGKVYERPPWSRACKDKEAAEGCRPGHE